MTSLIQGNSLEAMKGMKSNSVDLIVTSPPYADRRKNTYGGVTAEKYCAWFMPFASEMRRVLKETGSLFLNIKPHTKDGERELYVFELVIAMKRQAGFRFVDEFSWTRLGVPGKFKGRFKNAFEPVYHFSKTGEYTFNPMAVASPAKEVSLARYKRKACGNSQNGSGFGGMRKEITATMALPSNVLNIPQKSNQHTAQKKHPAVFPVELSDFFVKAFSDEGGVVLDPFMGSGTVGVSCKKLNRKFIGIDSMPEYVELAKERIGT